MPICRKRWLRTNSATEDDQSTLLTGLCRKSESLESFVELTGLQSLTPCWQSLFAQRVSLSVRRSVGDIGLSESDREFPALTGRSGMQRARGGHSHGSGVRLSDLAICGYDHRSAVFTSSGR